MLTCDHYTTTFILVAVYYSIQVVESYLKVKTHKP